jgi:hypothetical protein
LPLSKRWGDLTVDRFVHDSLLNPASSLGRDRGCNHLPVQNQQRAERMVSTCHSLVGQLVTPFDVGDVVGHFNRACALDG